MRRAAELEPKGIHFVGMGVSGGEEGARNGPSLSVLSSLPRSLAFLSKKPPTQTTLTHSFLVYRLLTGQLFTNQRTNQPIDHGRADTLGFHRWILMFIKWIPFCLGGCVQDAWRT